MSYTVLPQSVNTIALVDAFLKNNPLYSSYLTTPSSILWVDTNDPGYAFTYFSVPNVTGGYTVYEASIIYLNTTQIPGGQYHWNNFLNLYPTLGTIPGTFFYLPYQGATLNIATPLGKQNSHSIHKKNHKKHHKNHKKHHKHHKH